MNRTTIEVPVNIDELINRLSDKDKIELVKRLGTNVRCQKWSTFFSKIDKRIEKNQISQNEINRAVREVRKELYG